MADDRNQAANSLLKGKCYQAIFQRSNGLREIRWSAVALMLNGAKDVYIVPLSLLGYTFQNLDKLENLFKALERCYLFNKYLSCSVYLFLVL